MYLLLAYDTLVTCRALIPVERTFSVLGNCFPTTSLSTCKHLSCCSAVSTSCAATVSTTTTTLTARLNRELLFQEHLLWLEHLQQLLKVAPGSAMAQSGKTLGPHQEGLSMAATTGCLFRMTAISKDCGSRSVLGY